MNFILNKIFYFWKNKNFFIINNIEKKVGAATFNSKNVKFLIKKKRINIIFLQKCYREFDVTILKSKKLIIHYQIQLISKPVFFNFLNIYIDSVNFIKNKIKFKKDNWSSPILGAKGIGFESLCKNYEISQITIFYLFGNKKLFKPILEITYGLERIFFIFYSKIFFYEKYFLINNIFEFKNIKLLIIIYNFFFLNYKKKNFFISYNFLLKISNLFNVFDNLYFNNNYNRIKIILLISKISEKILEKCLIY